MKGDPPNKDKSGKDARSDREAKLAQALRANLRRRKAAPASEARPAPAPSTDDGDST
jgi:hypothetical protein